MFTLRFDMRAPAFGAPPTELYARRARDVRVGETHGCLAAVVCEHHGSDGRVPARRRCSWPRPWRRAPSAWR